MLLFVASVGQLLLWCLKWKMTSDRALLKWCFSRIQIACIHVWHWFTSESPDSKWSIDLLGISILFARSTLLSCYWLVDVFAIILILMFFTDQWMYSLKVFYLSRSATCFWDFTLDRFWWPQSPWVVRLATRDGWSRRKTLWWRVALAVKDPPCWSTLKGIWDPIKYPRNIQSRV